MMTNKRVGAPLGGRVHWLLLNLRRDFKAAYKVEFNYLTHSYYFFRKRKRTIVDFFIVIRTSKRCFRVSYHNRITKEFVYFSVNTSRQAALRMWFLFKRHEVLPEVVDS